MEIKHGRLILVRYTHSHKGKTWWLCQCDCGKKKILPRNAVISGHTKSCGCLYKETRTGRNIKHKMCGTKFYNVFRGMKARCYNKNIYDYKRYGRRGIKVMWKSFEEFKNDMYKSYLEHCKTFTEGKTSIDRVDNDGHYSKENCRWATPKIQANNRCTNIKMTRVPI